MADGAFPSLVSATRDVNAAANPIFTQLSDGSAVLGVTGGALDVNIASGAVITQYDVGSVAGATDTGMLGLVIRDDVLTTLADADGDYVAARVNSTGALWVAVDGTVAVTDNGGSLTVDNAALSVVGGGVEATALRVTIASDSTGILTVDDGGGSLTVDGTVAATQSGTWNIDTVTTLTSITNDVNIADGGNSITVDAVDLDIRALDHVTIGDSVRVGDGTETLAINTDGSINVNLVDTVVGDEIHDYDTAAAVASDATSNHDYTVANTTFLLKSVIVSGSGNVKFEIQTGPLASLATRAVGFLTGRQGDTKQVFFEPAIEVPVTSTGTVRVIRTNRQGSATDLYSTIIGIDQ